MVRDRELTAAIAQRDQEEKDGGAFLAPDLDQSVLEDDEYWAIGKVVVPDQIHTTGSEEEDVLVVPTFEFRQVCRASVQDSMAAAFWAARRIYTYIAFACGGAMTVVLRFKGKLMSYPPPPMRAPLTSFPQSMLFDWIGRRKTSKEVSEEIVAGFKRAEHLLSCIPIDSSLDRAVMSAGGVHWASDPLDRFMLSWRGLEVIAEEDLRVAQVLRRAGDAQVLQPYLDGNSSRSVPRIRTARRIEVTCARRAPGIATTVLDHLRGVRNIVAHGAVTASSFRTVYTSVPDLARLTRAVVGSAISEYEAEQGH